MSSDSKQTGRIGQDSNERVIESIKHGAPSKMEEAAADPHSHHAEQSSEQSSSTQAGQAVLKPKSMFQFEDDEDPDERDRNMEKWFKKIVDRLRQRMDDEAQDTENEWKAINRLKIVAKAIGQEISEQDAAKAKSSGTPKQ